MKGAVRRYILIAVLYARAPADMQLLESSVRFSMGLLILALRPNMKSRLTFTLLLSPDHTYTGSISLFIVQFKTRFLSVLAFCLNDSLCFQCALLQRKA
jgi:hypothetical protein